MQKIGYIEDVVKKNKTTIKFTIMSIELAAALSFIIGFFGGFFIGYDRGEKENR